MNCAIKKEDLPVYNFHNGSELIGIPSIHYSLEFTAVLNSVCRDKNLRPEAIAVEMNNSVVCEVLRWLKETGVCPDKKTKLPSGLGVAFTNTLIHPEKMSRVRAIERYFNESLYNIPDQELIYKFLQIKTLNVFPLCNTDSVFEALRCSLEIEVPVFGIDSMHCFGNYNYPFLFEDFAGTNLKEFVEHNAPAAANITNESETDKYISLRREKIMAARLKALSLKYKRIVFACGLSHWQNLVNFMDDAALKPATLITDQLPSKPDRIILHPSIAGSFVSKFPCVAEYYEERRPHCLLDDREIMEHVPYGKILEGIYGNARASYSQNFKENRYEELSFRSLFSFEQMCRNTRLLELKSTLSMYDFLLIAKSVFPDEFFQVLTEEFFKKTNWADPDDFPGIPVLAPDTVFNSLGRSTVVKYFQKSDGFRDIVEKHPSWANDFFGPRSFFHEYRTERDTEYLQREINKKGWSIFVWPPKEVELFLLTLRVIELAENMECPVAKKYTGAMEAGFNMKETIRQSIFKNKIQVYVNSKMKIRKNEIPDAQPVVCIFENNPDKKPFIKIYDAGIYCSDFIDEETYKKYTREGTNVIGHISYFGDSKPGSRFDNMVADLGFGSMCINSPQSAYWLVRNKFQACPVLKTFGVSALNSYYKSKFNLTIGDDFRENLMLYGLPYCHSGKLYVLAPGNFEPSLYVKEQARRLHVEIKIVPLSMFNSRRIQSVRERICCYSTDDHGIFFSSETENIMGQKFNTGFELLPPRLRNELHKIYRDFSFLKPKNKTDEDFPF